MSSRRIRLAWVIGLIAGVTVFGQGPAPKTELADAAKLLDDALRDPGGWAQMCGGMGAPALPLDVPVPLYSYGPQPPFYISRENMATLRAQGSAIGAEIERRLEKMDFSNPKPSSAGSGTASGQDPSGLSVQLLQVVFELNVVGALPGLLRVEDDLHRRLQNATARNAGILPEISDDGASFEGWYARDVPAEQGKFNYRLFKARLMQRRLLSVTAALLRHERYEPILNSEMERRYFEVLQKRAEGPQLKAIKTPQQIPLQQRGWVVFDPIHNLPVAYSPVVEYMPYTEELRGQIRQFAQDFLKQREAAAQRAGGVGRVK